MVNRKLIEIDAPSNLGLRPPKQGSVPGCYKMSWALRDRGLLTAIGAEDGGVLVPPQYQSQWKAGDGVRNAEGIAMFSIQLANRLQQAVEGGKFALVIGGDCSILIGNLLALRRMGRYGLVFLDAHSDFRHEGNAPAIGAAAGEDLAIATGRGDTRLVNLEGLAPYVRNEDIYAVGTRPSDEDLDELLANGIKVATSDVLIMDPTEVCQSVLSVVTAQTQGFWIHLDVDVIDSSEMPAVDSPEPDGPSFALITAVLQELVRSPKCVGMELTIYDPDLDPDGVYADRILECLTEVFSD